MRCWWCHRIIWPWQRRAVLDVRRFHRGRCLNSARLAEIMAQPVDGWDEAELREAWGK